jgi:hypothetical protein
MIVALSSPNARRHIQSELRGVQNDLGLLVIEYNLNGQPAFQANKQLLASLVGMASAYSASGDIVDDEGALRQERQGGVIELDQITSSFFHAGQPNKPNAPHEAFQTAG